MPFPYYVINVFKALYFSHEYLFIGKSLFLTYIRVIWLGIAIYDPIKL